MVEPLSDIVDLEWQNGRYGQDHLDTQPFKVFLASLALN